jgi:hypothetical protein
MQHINNPIEIAPSAIPPSVFCIKHQVVKYVHFFIPGYFLQFHAIEQRFINSIRNTATKGGGESFTWRAGFGDSVMAVIWLWVAGLTLMVGIGVLFFAFFYEHDYFYFFCSCVKVGTSAA